jgi:hypothetical protein
LIPLRDRKASSYSKASELIEAPENEATGNDEAGNDEAGEFSPEGFCGK